MQSRAYDPEGFYVKNSLHCILAKAEGYDLKYLLRNLNSNLLDRFFQNKIGATGQLFSQMKIAYIRKLPIRPINFADPADAARHEQMVELVERMLALHKQLPDARTPQAQTLLQHQIDATDRQIDRLVYELYDLTEEEITIFEEATV